MAQATQAPYVATATSSSWVDTYNLLQKATNACGLFWSIMETPFEIALTKDSVCGLALTPDTLKVPENGGQIIRGRVFGDKGEIRIRYDSLHTVYTLVLVSDSSTPWQVEGFSPARRHDTDESEEDRLYWEEGWEMSNSLQTILWGEPWKEKENQWFTSRIPAQLVYPGLTQVKDALPLVKITEYIHWGQLEFYRFEALATTDSFSQS